MSKLYNKFPLINFHESPNPLVPDLKNCLERDIVDMVSLGLMRVE